MTADLERPRALIAQESTPAQRIEVPERLRITHPLLVGTREIWRMRRRPRYRPPREQWPAHFNINVSPSLEARTLRLLQALFTALDQRGHSVAAGDKEALIVTVYDQPYTIVVRERLRQAPPSVRVGADSGTRARTLEPTGELEIRLDNAWPSRSWRDKKNCRLEDHLNAIVIALLECVCVERTRQAERERQHRQERDRAAARARAKAAEQASHRQIAQLRGLVRAAQDHRELARLVTAVKDAVAELSAESPLRPWLRWVEEYVDYVDILRRFRTPEAELTVYFCASSWRIEHVLRDGFIADRDVDGPEDRIVELTDVRFSLEAEDSACLALQVQEAAVLPYETFPTTGDHRRFLVPLDVANGFPRERPPGECPLPSPRPRA